MSDNELMNFNDDLHSHYWIHYQLSGLLNCEMCKLVSAYNNYNATPTTWKPPRMQDGSIDDSKIDDYIAGLSIIYPAGLYKRPKRIWWKFWTWKK